MGTLTRIETVANRLLEFPGNKYCTVEISKEELKELEADVAEEYDDVELFSVGFDRSIFQMQLCGIFFTLKII